MSNENKPLYARIHMHDNDFWTELHVVLNQLLDAQNMFDLKNMNAEDLKEYIVVLLHQAFIVRNLTKECVEKEQLELDAVKTIFSNIDVTFTENINEKDMDGNYEIGYLALFENHQKEKIYIF